MGGRSSTNARTTARIGGQAHGVAARQELLAAGLSAGEVDHRVQIGLLLVGVVARSGERRRPTTERRPGRQRIPLRHRVEPNLPALHRAGADAAPTRPPRQLDRLANKATVRHYATELRAIRD
jgi:hypothetical protein